MRTRILLYRQGHNVPGEGYPAISHLYLRVAALPLTLLYLSVHIMLYAEAIIIALLRSWVSFAPNLCMI